MNIVQPLPNRTVGLSIRRGTEADSVGVPQFRQKKWVKRPTSCSLHPAVLVSTEFDKRKLLQLRVLRLGLLQDGDVGVGVFPEGEEVFVGS
jgi:hypothetical protein